MLIACDLFCGGGGAAKGMEQAGFQHIDGYDLKDQPDYPYEFFQQNALDVDIEPYDFIWASPPCQHFSIGTRKHNRDKHDDLVDVIRDKLIASGKPYIIENVPNAPLIDPVTLCGTMFGLKVFRHRIFESNIPLFVDMQCAHQGHRAKNRRTEINNDFFTVAGHNTGTMAEWSDAMGIHWMTKKTTLAEAIPPAYSEYLCKQIIEWIKA